MRRILLTSLLASVTTISGCLPADARPEPGRVYATAQLPEELQGEVLTFETGDGWTVSLHELMVSIGNLVLDGSKCSSYSEARYRRLLDFRVTGPQKVAEVWGLDDCRIGYAVRIPDDDAVSGTNVTKEELDLMYGGLVPVSSPSGVVTSKGMALHVVGKAVKKGVTVHFDWGFADNVDFTDCKRNLDGVLEEYLPLEGGETIRVDLTVDPRKLFYIESTSLIQAIVDADQVSGNANGRVAIDELIATSVSGQPLNLGEVLRTKSYPSMFVYDNTGTCTLGNSDGHGPGGHF